MKGRVTHVALLMTVLVSYEVYIAYVSLFIRRLKPWSPSALPEAGKPAATRFIMILSLIG